MDAQLDWLVEDGVTSVSWDDRTGSWNFRTGLGRWLYTTSRWQVRTTDAVELASGDHGQSYGLGAPIDAQIRALELLAGRGIQAVHVDPVSADLRIDFEGEVSFMTFNDSSGYEGWHLGRDDGAEWVAQGGGKIVELFS